MNIHRISFIPLLCLSIWAGVVGCGPSTAPVAAQQAVYHCPMHPRYTSDRPGECPICHMDLVLVDPSKKTEEPIPGDRVMVNVSKDKEQWIGVRTAVVAMKKLEKKVRASAEAVYDPELYGALVEHRELLAARERAVARKNKGDMARAAEMIEASRIRLAQRGLSESQIARLLAPSNPKGAENSTGIGDQSVRWVYVQVYENEAALIEPGQQVELTSPALLEPRVGTVDSIDRIVGADSRTVRVRVSVPGALRWPRMYLEAAIRVPLGTVLAVPKEAVIDTGLKRLVYVQTQEGHYSPQEVTLGRETDEDVEILDGLMEDDVVAASGQFLIDSESRLRAVIAEAGHAH